MTAKRAKKSSKRRNTQKYKKVDPFWQENPHRLAQKEAHLKRLKKKKGVSLESRNKKLRHQAINSLVKKHGIDENDKYADNFCKEKKFEYKKMPGESDHGFKQRMQDDVDMSIMESKMTKRVRDQQGLGPTKGANVQNSKNGKTVTTSEDFKNMIRGELVEKGRISARKSDGKNNQNKYQNAKQFNNSVKKSEKDLKKLDKLLDKQEEDLYKDKIEFGERVDDVFRPKVLPRGCKNRPAKKNNGLLYLPSKGKTELTEDQQLRSKAVNSMHRKKIIADERKKVIDSYREMQAKKMKF